jgi:hypothetical protein
MKSQRGVFSFDLAAALLVGSLVAFVAWQATARTEDTKLASLQADQLESVRSAAHRLVMANYAAYQAGAPITRNGVTLPGGSSPGQALRPTVANLRALDLGITSMPDTGFYRTLAGAGFDVRITRDPVCTTNSASPDCRVTGLVCLDQPLNAYGGTNIETDAHGLGVILGQLGGHGLASLPGNATRVISSNGSRNLANPQGDVPGVVCAAFGWGTEGDDFLRLEDTRDPNFRGNVTVAGTVTADRVTANSIGAGSGTRADGTRCSLAEILTSGQVIARSGACIQRAFMDGANGRVGAADASGTTRVLLDGSTGAITSSDGTGAARAGIRYNGLGQSEGYADNLLNNAGNAGIRSDGSVFGTNANFSGTTTMSAAVLNSTAIIGSTCSPDGGMSWTVQGTRWVMARCTGGVWTTTTGFSEGAIGGSCGSTNGVPGIAGNGSLLICQGGTWVSMLDRAGRAVLMGSALVQNGTTVAKPTCLSGATGTAAYLALGSEQQAIQVVNRYITESGSSWFVSILSQTGTPVPGEHVLMSYCVY